ncbi:MAG TPA: HAMP domain-containing sensor histidine kinase [Solirubrobacteraceae bacterium]
MSAAVSLGGWAMAGLAALIVVSAARSFGDRMEAVARACHELRGPLTAARLGLSLGERVGELSPGRLRAIDTELGRAALALDDLAEVRGGAVRLRGIDRVDIRALLVGSVEAWQGSAAAAGVGLRGGWDGAGGAVWGDHLRLAQAVGNLVANAIEHGGGVVAVRGSVRHGLVRIVVSDDGPGLPAPVRELSRGARRGRGARGRGLAIAAAVAHAHGGRLASAPAKRGARLVLELPAAGAGASLGS